MHYFIDGYNMIFRLLHNNHNLQTQRESIIYDLNKKISLIKLDVSLVFDSAFQKGERTRSHYDFLEIIFSAEGETADDYILDEIKNASYPQQETVVTSDKKLARQVRHGFAHTESVEDFILWLNRSYKNKLRQIKKDNSSLPTFQTSSPDSLLLSSSNRLPTEYAPLEAYDDYYIQIFESEWQEILKKESLREQESASVKKPTRKPRRLRDPFQTPPVLQDPSVSEMERWLKTFEKRLLDFDA